MHFKSQKFPSRCYYYLHVVALSFYSIIWRRIISQHFGVLGFSPVWIDALKPYIQCIINVRTGKCGFCFRWNFFSVIRPYSEDDASDIIQFLFANLFYTIRHLCIFLLDFRLRYNCLKLHSV